jgi:hypothetical protein
VAVDTRQVLNRRQLCCESLDDLLGDADRLGFVQFGYGDPGAVWCEGDADKEPDNARIGLRQGRAY